MSRGNSSPLFCRIFDFVFGSGDSEDEAELEKSGAIIYEIMDFIARQKDSDTNLFEQAFFCSSIKKENFSCAEAVSFGVRQGWIEQIEDKIKITRYGFDYEKDFWKSFR